MNITSIKIRNLFEGQPLKAICSVTFDEQIAVHDIKLVEAGGRVIVVMPAKKMNNGKFVDIVHPINADARSEIENAIIEKYIQATKK